MLLCTVLLYAVLLRAVLLRAVLLRQSAVVFCAKYAVLEYLLLINICNGYGTFEPRQVTDRFSLASKPSTLHNKIKGTMYSVYVFQVSRVSVQGATHDRQLKNE